MTDRALPVEVRLAREAMATRFELVLRGRVKVSADGFPGSGDLPGSAQSERVSLRAAGEQALDAAGELERILSFYRPSSALSGLNRHAGSGAARVHGLLFEILADCRRLFRETGGAFDPSVGPLMRMWGLTGGTFREPDPEEFLAVRSRCGFDRVRLREVGCEVELTAPGMALDLGGIGKGFALDEMRQHLVEAGVEHALLHGGTSSVSAVGLDGDRPWRIGIPDPGDQDAPLITTIDLSNRSLSVSTPLGKGHTAGGRYIGHVLDPRTGYPVAGCDMAVVLSERALDADALSTALLVLGDAAAELPVFASEDLQWLTVSKGADGTRRFRARGIPIEPVNK